MDIGNWNATIELNTIYRRARDLGLETNIAELEAFGFTVVEPGTLAAGDLFDRMLPATISVCKKMDEAGAKLSTLLGAEGDYARLIYGLMVQDDVFAEASMHPVAITLARYLTGASCRLFTASAFVKRGRATPTLLHTDTAGTPPPLYPYGLVCNISWILTDYTEATGTFAMVPGSHRYCRHPTAIEQPKMMGGPNDDICIPVIARPGSLVVFNGNTWHGSYPKQDQAFRAHVVTAYCRNYIMQAENFDAVPATISEKYGDEFLHLLGRDTWQGCRTDGPRTENLASVLRANFTPSA